MAKDFSNPKKLGFLRVIQFFFGFNILVTLLLLVTLIKGSYTLGFADILDLLNLIFDAIAFWLIWRRKNITRIFVISFCLFNIISGIIYNVATGQFDIVNQLISSMFDIILLAYFITSRRVKAVLVQPFSVEQKEEQLSQDINYFKPKTWGFWRNLIIYFCVYSVVGHWMEAGYCTLIRFGLLPGIYDPNSQIWSDWLYPFMVYGCGAVACVLILFPVKNFLQKRFKGLITPLLISFVFNALVCTLIELVMGLAMNQPLPDGTMPLWDYRDMFCNFMGQVCLQNALAFGFVATLMTWVIYPNMEKGLSHFSKEMMNVVFIAVVVGFAILIFMYYINFPVPDLLGEDAASVQLYGEAVPDASAGTTATSSQ